jgi:hypothetical protein
MLRLLMYFVLAAMFAPLAIGIGGADSQPAPPSDDYATRIQPIFDSRCIACHSCYNALCQLNLQSYSGLARGANKRNVYEPTADPSARLGGLPQWPHAAREAYGPFCRGDFGDRQRYRRICPLIPDFPMVACLACSAASQRCSPLGGADRRRPA